MGTRAVLSFLSSLALALLLAVPAVRAEDQEPINLTGCLNVHEVEDWYVLTDETSGQEIRVRGIPNLADYAQNQRVTVTGRWVESEDADEEVFEAMEIERLGACA